METIIAAWEMGPIIGVIVTFIVLIVGIILLTIKGTRLLNRVEGRIEILEGKVETNCVEIKDLEAKDNAMGIKLTDINVTLKQVNVMTTKIYDHFFEEGIKSGRRTEDK